MRVFKVCMVALTFACLAFASISVQAQTPGQMRHEMRKQAAQQQNDWRKQQDWRKYQKRYFGSVLVKPLPNESMNDFRTRVLNRCNTQWNICSSRCNVARRPEQRNMCLANCSNFLYECRSGW